MIALALLLALVPDTLSCTTPWTTAVACIDSAGPLTGTVYLEAYGSAWDCDAPELQRKYLRRIATGVVPGRRVKFTIPVSVGQHLWGVEVRAVRVVGDSAIAGCFSNAVAVDYRPGHTRAERDSMLRAALAADSAEARLAQAPHVGVLARLWRWITK